MFKHYPTIIYDHLQDECKLNSTATLPKHGRHKKILFLSEMCLILLVIVSMVLLMI